MTAARRGQKGFPNCDGHRETSPVRPPGRPSPHSTIPASAPPSVPHACASTPNGTGGRTGRDYAVPGKVSPTPT
jgi:hypothetical protein